MLKIVDETTVAEHGTDSTWDQLLQCLDEAGLTGVATGQFVMLYENEESGHILTNMDELEHIITALEVVKLRLLTQQL